MRSSTFLTRASAVCLMVAGIFLSVIASACCSAATGAEDGKLRIIVFGAHPDDCELKAAGTAALWAAQGHHVKFVSVTNGDIGHAEMSGGALAQRRTAEVKEAAKVLGIEAEVLDIHDGELMPTLENRKLFVKLIREWKADLVMGELEVGEHLRSVDGVQGFHGFDLHDHTAVHEQVDAESLDSRHRGYRFATTAAFEYEHGENKI